MPSLPMLDDQFVDGSTGSEGPPPLHAFALLALFGRCLVAGAITSIAVWMLVSALLNRFGWLISWAFRRSTRRTRWATVPNAKSASSKAS